MSQNIDLRDVFDRLGVEYHTRKNVSGNNVALRCPWCGDEDPSAHLTVGVPPNPPYYQCWRNPNHRGRDPYRLLRALSDRPQRELVALLARYRVSALLAETPAAPVSRKITHIEDMRHWRMFAGVYRAERPYYDYLRVQRGFGRWTRGLIRKHGLRYAISGEMRGRVIFPIYDANGEIVNAVGRAIGSIQPRYRVVPSDAAPVPARGLVYNGHRPARRVIVVEGPLDALKLDVAAGFYHAVPVATMTVTPGAARILALARMEAEEYVILYDSGADVAAYRLRDELSALVSGLVRVVTGVLETDPGDLRPEQVPVLLYEVFGGFYESI